MTSYKEGDEVRVFPVSHRRRSQSPEGYPGTVTKTGRKYGTAVFEVPWTIGGKERTQQCEIAFDMTNGMQRGVTEYRVRTAEQIKLDQRREVALFIVKDAGIEFSFGRERFLTLEQIEALAEVVRNWKD